MAHLLITLVKCKLVRSFSLITVNYTQKNINYAYKIKVLHVILQNVLAIFVKLQILLVVCELYLWNSKYTCKLWITIVKCHLIICVEVCGS